MTYKQNFKNLGLIAAIVLAPFAAKASDIGVGIEANGTCQVGTCPPATGVGLTDGQSNSDTFNFDVTVNGDLYDVAGSYSASYSHADGSTIAIDPTVTYIGGSVTTTNDTITFDYFQNYVDPIGSSCDGTYEETVPLFLSGNAGPGSTIQGQLLFDGQSVGLVGPFGPGTYNVSNSADLTGLTAGNTLMADFNFVVQFNAGTQPNAGAGATTPEPALAFPAGLSLLLFVYGARRRARRSNS